jgi:hypothetical protein
MKTNLSKIYLFGFLVLCIFSGCKIKTSESTGFDVFSAAVESEEKGNLFKASGEPDSAKARFKKSIVLYYMAENPAHRASDSIFCRKMSRLNNTIGIIFDSLRKPDSALSYYLESLNWARLSKNTHMLIGAEAFVGYAFYRSGLLKPAGSEDRNKLYRAGTPYLKLAVKTADSSLGNVEDRTVADICTMLKRMYSSLGDSASEHCYTGRVNEIRKRHGLNPE